MNNALTNHLLRPDYEIIANWISSGSRVLDLGCGDGKLLRELAARKEVVGYGVEIDPVSIPRCIDNGINVIQRNLNRGLADFNADSFDYVVLSLTLQAMKDPSTLLDEMLRVGRIGIVSFPNFGHWKVDSSCRSWDICRSARHCPMRGTIHLIFICARYMTSRTSAPARILPFSNDAPLTTPIKPASG